MKGLGMNKIQTKTVGRFTAAVAISMGLAASAVSIASASTNGSHHSDHDGFAGQTHWDNGLGGLVTTVTLTSGTLTSVTVTAHDGTPSTFSITGTTTFSEGGATVPATDLVAGDFADIEVLSSAMTTATSINIELARFGGVVTLVSGDTITITGHKGVTQTIVVGTTTYTKDGAPAVSTDVMAGDLINAQGTIGATATTLNATSVMIETLHGSIDGGHVGHGHRHFDGRGFGHHQGSQNQGSQNQGFGERGSSDHGNIRR